MLQAELEQLKLLQVEVEKLKQLQVEVVELRKETNKLNRKLEPLECEVENLRPLQGEVANLRKKVYRLETFQGKVSTLEPKVIKLETDLRKGAVAWNGPFMHNLAAQILLFVRGDQPKSEVDETRYFQNFLPYSPGDRYWRLRDCYGATDNYSLGRELDEVISKRNSKIHYKSVEDLDDDVRLARSLLKKYPALSAANKHQCITIECYDTWKALFREKFSKVRQIFLR